jgi:MATE family multidrug resistance protein
MWAANVLNIGLNLALIPAFGAEGSAMATFAARFFLAGTLVVWILRLPDAKALGVHGGEAGPGYPAILRIGFAAALSQAVESGAFGAMSIIAGRGGASEVAAYQILLNSIATVFMIALGIATATAVIVSEAVGAQAPKTARQAGWLGLGLNTLAMGVGALAFIVAGGSIARAFTSDPALAGLVAANMALAALILAPDGAQTVAASALRACGDNWFPTASHVAAYAFVMPALAFQLAEVMGRGVAGLLEAILWASLLSAGILIGRFALRATVRLDDSAQAGRQLG